MRPWAAPAAVTATSPGAPSEGMAALARSSAAPLSHQEDGGRGEILNGRDDALARAALRSRDVIGGHARPCRIGPTVPALPDGPAIGPTTCPGPA